MSLALLFPAGLLALGALLVPLLLHLARRSEHRAIDFSALRWLSARTRPRRRLRLVEHGLLLMRLMLIAALALLMAGPMMTGGVRSRSWTLVAPGVSLTSVSPAAQDDNSERRWLAPGFPPLDQPRPAGDVPVGSLLRELDARLPRSSEMTVWVPRELAGLDGSGIELARSVRWRIAPGDAMAAASPAVIPEPFAVRLDPGRETALAYLRAAWQAWWHDPAVAIAKRVDARPLTDISSSSGIPPNRNGTLVWLRPGELPLAVRNWILAGGTILMEPHTKVPLSFELAAVAWRDDDGRPLARAVRSGRGRVVRLEAPLDASALPGLHDGSFAAVLRELLHPREAVPARALARDVEPTSNAAMRRSGVPMPRELDIEAWLTWLIAAGFVLERFIATAARRWRSA